MVEPTERGRELAMSDSGYDENLIDCQDKLAASWLRVAELENVFRHIHQAGPDGDLDTCRKCGLDLRDSIHERMKREAAEEDA